METIGWKEAKERGLPSYFTGKPCKNGHIAKRYITGACHQCIVEHCYKKRASQRQAAKSPNAEFIKRELTSIHRRSVAGATKRNIPHDITRDQITELYERSRGYCEFSGIKFAYSENGRGKVRPFAPSLDRIDSNKGYTMSNCRLVCAAVNVALNAFGDDNLDLICAARMAVLKGERK